MKNLTPNIFLYGEFGIFPIEIDSQTRMVAFWTQLIGDDNPKICSSLYNFANYDLDINKRSGLKLLKYFD